MRRTRLVVVLVGGAALGAYEAGALAALLLTVRELRRDGQPVTIDVLTGASAGAIVAYIAAVAAQSGRDPVAVLHHAWVEAVDADLLRDSVDLADHLDPDPQSAPLAFDRLPAGLRDLWDQHDTGEPLQDTPLVLHTSLTDLAGRRDTFDGPRGPDSIAVPTFVRDRRFVIPSGADHADLDDEVLDTVLASAAHPGGFAPRLVDGRWTVDGAMVESRPLHRALASRDALSSDADDTDGGAAEGGTEGSDTEGGDSDGSDTAPRTVLAVIDPRSEDPEGARRWRDADDRPNWMSGLARALALLGAQGVHDDVRALLAEDRDDLVVDLVTPVLLEGDGDDVPELLAGDFLGDFGGFLSRDLRHSDFVLGYASTIAWAEAARDSLGDDTADWDRVLAAVRDAHEHDWRSVNLGEARLAELDAAARLAALRVAASALSAAGRAVLADPLHAARDLVDATVGRLRGLLPD